MSKTLKYTIVTLAIVGASLYFVIKLSLSRFQRQVVFQANAEVDKWIPYSETSPEVSQILQEYWADGVGQNYSLSQIQSNLWQGENFWSAAYISWVMRVSGAGGYFPYNQSHSYYVYQTKQNRLNNVGKFKAYRTSEVKPRKSDIVCKYRGNSVNSYDDVQYGDPLHCDIVTDVRRGEIDIVGGNVSNKVGKSTISLDNNGYLNEPKYFTIIKSTL